MQRTRKLICKRMTSKKVSDFFESRATFAVHWLVSLNELTKATIPRSQPQDRDVKENYKNNPPDMWLY